MPGRVGIGGVADFDEGELNSVDATGTPVGVGYAGDSLCAARNRCPHLGLPRQGSGGLRTAMSRSSARGTTRSTDRRHGRDQPDSLRGGLSRPGSLAGHHLRASALSLTPGKSRTAGAVNGPANQESGLDQ